MKLLRRAVTPERVKTGALALFLTSLTTGVMTNLAMFVTLIRPAPSVLPQTPPAASPAPLPARPVPALPTQSLGGDSFGNSSVRPMQSLREVPRSLGAAAAPRRVEFENHVSISQAGKTIALPPHVGTADVKLGPVILRIPAGETFEWDPVDGLDVTTDVKGVFAFSDVPAEDATHAVILWGTGEDAPAPGDKRELDPVLYVPEALSLPLNIQNNTSREAIVHLEVWTNSEDVGGGGPDL